MYAQSTSNAVAGPSSAGMSWGNSQPVLRMEDAVVETVVTHTTRTTTSFTPIALPRIPPPEDISIPNHLDGDVYPLAREPCPPEMKTFALNLGGKRVFIQEGSPSLPDSPLADKGFARRLPPGASRGGVSPRVGVLEAINRSRKRPLDSSRVATLTPLPTQGLSTPPKEGAELDSPPPRKRVRGLGIDIPRSATATSAPLSPRPSPPPESSALPSVGSGLEAAALFSLPSIVSHFDALPDKLQQHVLMHLLRRSRMPTVQRIHTFTGGALRRDFITSLPHEIAVQVLQYLDAPTLAVALRVSRKWRKMIDGERSVWHQRLVEDGLHIGMGCEEDEEQLIERRLETIDWKKSILIGTPSEDDYADPLRSWDTDTERCVPLKHVYRRRRTNDRNWKQPPIQYCFPGHFTQIPGHGAHVITCTQFDQDKILTASDDNTVNIYDLRSGQRRKRLDGHEGGVWAMEYYGDTLVTGSTDRMVRIWDLETYQTTHIFAGHTSTIRCLQIVEPVLDKKTGKYYPPYPIVITGSRDRTIRVWRLPNKNDPSFNMDDIFLHKNGVPPEDNPYHLACLKGHTDAVRAIAAHGRICVSGSYDSTIRVWDLMRGKCIHVLRGHEGRVYSIVYDRFRKRCASGSVDNTVRVWDIQTGQCLRVLTGHTSLVGLLDMSPNYMVSAAADASLRVWDANTIEYKTTLVTNASSITCFAHDERKVVSGSDGCLKLWDITTGRVIRDLFSGVQSVWQVVFRDNLLVAPTNRGGNFVFEVFDFGRVSHVSGVDDESLDALRRPPWEKAKAGSFMGSYEGFSTPRPKMYRQLPAALPANDDWRLSSSSPGPAGAFLPFGHHTPAAKSGSRRSGRLAIKSKHADVLPGGSSSSAGKTARRSTRKASSPARATRASSSLFEESSSKPHARQRPPQASVSKHTRSQGTSFAPTFDGDEDEHEEDELVDDNYYDDMDDIQLIG